MKGTAMSNNAFFTASRVVSVDQTKIWAPPEKDMIPYVDVGYQGGSYWASADATKELFGWECTDLVALGWDEVEKYLDLPLRQIMARPYDGYDGGFYWLINQPEGYDPKAALQALEVRLNQEYRQATTNENLLAAAGHILWPQSDDTEAWWYRITIVGPANRTLVFGVNRMTENKKGDRQYYSQAQGRDIRYRSIPVYTLGPADMSRVLDVFHNRQIVRSYRIDDFVTAKIEFMGGDDGMVVLRTSRTSNSDARKFICALPHIDKILRAVNQIHRYLITLK